MNSETPSLSGENGMWPLELGAISGIACQSMVHYLLSAGQMMGKQKTSSAVPHNSLT